MEQIGESNPPTPPATGRNYGSNLMVVYQDAPTLAWAREMYERVKNLVGPEAVHNTWWKANDLNSPAVLAGAVSTALRADVIVVALYAAEALPLPLYVWIESWLPHRPHRSGSLMALMAMPPRPARQSERVRDYLRLVARQGHLDFLVEERKLAAGRADLNHKEASLTIPLAKTALRKVDVPAGSIPRWSLHGATVGSERRRPVRWHSGARCSSDG